MDSILADLGRRKVYFPQTRKQTGQSVSSEAIQFTRWLLEKDPLKRPLAMHALKDGWLTCDTPGGPLTQKPEVWACFVGERLSSMPSVLGSPS